MSFRRSALFSAAVACFLSIGVLAAQVNNAPSTLDQRIEDGLTPPVLVDGQSLPSSGGQALQNAQRPFACP